ncbi:MAG: hypothetical protein J5764_05425 [Bacteroidales bacterium]|nr:hypothetical protein [Bacteroidales bacterium]
MQNKLQELTDRLYSEGLAKGKEEGERILAQAREEADRLVAEAQKEAERLVAEARSQAEALRKKAESDVITASKQALQASKKDIEGVVTMSATAPVKELCSDAAFMKEIISAVAARFDSESSQDLSLVLPEKLQGELEPWLRGSLAAKLKHGVEGKFSSRLAGGFKIGPADGSWYVDFSDETFTDLISSYLRPVTRKILFGE